MPYLFYGKVNLVASHGVERNSMRMCTTSKVTASSSRYRGVPRRDANLRLIQAVSALATTLCTAGLLKTYVAYLIGWRPYIASAFQVFIHAAIRDIKSRDLSQ